MRTLEIKTQDNTERRALLGVLVAFGYTSELYNGEMSSNVDEIIDDTQHNEFPAMEVDMVEKSIDFRRFTTGEESFDWDQDMVQIIIAVSKQTSIKVQLNEDYDAFVSEDGVSVGCQTFSFEVIDKVVEAMKAFRE